MIQKPYRAASHSEQRLEQTDRLNNFIEYKEKEKSAEFDLEGMMRRLLGACDEFGCAILICCKTTQA